MGTLLYTGPPFDTPSSDVCNPTLGRGSSPAKLRTVVVYYTSHIALFLLVCSFAQEMLFQ